MAIVALSLSLLLLLLLHSKVQIKVIDFDAFLIGGDRFPFVIFLVLSS